ncbi:MAG TPA: zinc-binding dehydrogenase, partial [Thermotogota bacterium]|nr:zinc-binding dehydrogenase [Thermotogota bacterium]
GNAVFTVTTGGVAGKSTLITGAGPIGLMAIQVAKALGAGPIIVSEVKDFRIDMALKNGADYVFNPTKEDVHQKIMRLTNGEGVEAALEMSGNEKALGLCIDALLPSGHISALGVFDKPFPIDINKVIFKNITLYGITGRKMFETWYIASSLLLNKRVDLNKIVTHLLPFEEWEKGFLLMEQGNCGKIVLKIAE